jgi:acetyl esterase/lipase
MKRIWVAALLGILPVVTPAADPALKVIRDVSYKAPGAALTDYERERCRLDVTLPPSGKDFSTLVWFHGGGLKNGDKDLPSEYVHELAASLAQGGVAVVTPNYRLSPKATYPAYVDDAAAAFAWTVAHIAEHGGNPRRVFIGGHSAGGYLALLVGFDPSRLQPHGLGLDAVAGIAQVSGQIFTHYTVREERGQSRFNVTADDAAPSRYISRDLPPVLTLFAQNDMPSRAEENQFLMAALKAAGHRALVSRRIEDRSHASVGHNIRNLDDPARREILDFIALQSLGR